VRIGRQQREVINAIMRSEIAPDAGLEKITQEITALMK
jgi:hypothetical protein